MIFRRANLRRQLVSLTDEQEFNTLKEAISIMNNLLKADKILVSEEEYFKSNDYVPEFEYLQLDTLEAVMEVDQPDAIRLFAESLCSDSLVNNRRIRDALMFYDNIVNLVRSYSSSYIPLTIPEVDNLKALVKACLGHLSYFLIYQFGLDETIDNFDKGEEPTVDLIFHKYCDQQNLDYRSLILKIKGVAIVYRPKLEVFEEYPELEEEFYEIAGPWVQDFELLEEKLTIDMVKLVIKEEVDVEELVKQLEQSAKED